MRVSHWRAYFLLAFSFSLFNPYQLVGAQQAPASSGPVNLDLSSTTTDQSPGRLVGSAPVNIQVGGANMAVSAGSHITAAERLAVYQVVSTGQQSIILGAQGNAVGGTFTMGPNFSNYVSSLNIPSGVTAIKNFGAQQTLNLTGNLTNSGTLYAISNNAAVTNAIINAANITNNAGGLLTTVLPAGGIAGYSNLLTNLGLTLSAVNNIVNAGTISSSGSLTAMAGGSIINGLPSATSTAVMQAIGNLNLQTSNLVNSGIIASQTANINIATQNALQINNLGGILKAPGGAINIRESGFYSNVITQIMGGDIISKELNINAAGGALDLDVNSLSGVLNMTAADAHASVSNGTLTLGDLTLSGDPAFYNKNGDVLLQGNISTFGAPLAVVASGNITTTAANPVSISTQGGALNMVAGAVFTAGGPASVQPPAAPVNNVIIITALGTNGNIFLNDVGTIQTDNLLGSGGDIQLVAPGSIAVLGPITTSGLGVGKRSGSVDVIAGSTSVGGTAVRMGSISTIGFFGADSGNVSIANARPNILNGQTNCIIYVNGGLSFPASGTWVASNTPGTNPIILSSIDTSCNNCNSGSVSIKATGSTVRVASINTTATLGNPGDVFVNSKAFLSTGSIMAEKTGTAIGTSAVVSISAQQIVTLGGDVSTLANLGSGGNITIIAGGDINAGNLNCSGVGQDGGIITAISASGNIFADQIISIGVINGGTANMSAANTLAARYINTEGFTTTGGTIQVAANDVCMFGNFGGNSLNSRGATFGGNIQVQARDASKPFTVGTNTPNGTNGNIIADGAGGFVQLSTCGDLRIVPGAFVSAIGGTVVSDKACCGSASSSNALVGEKLVAITTIPTPSPTLPNTSSLSGTILPTDTLLGNNDALPLVPLAPGLGNGNGSAFVGSGLVSDNGGGIISDNGGGLVSDNGGGLVSDNGGGLLNEGGAGLVSERGNGLLNEGGAGLLNEHGNGLLNEGGAGLVSERGNGLLNEGGAGLVSDNGGGLASGWANSNGGLVCTSCGGSMRGIAYTATSAASKTLTLTKGAALYNPQHKDVTLHTTQGIVHIAPKAVALMLETGNSLAVYNLHDNHKDDIVVETSNGLVSLAPGQMLNLSHSSGDFQSVCDGRGITYRNARALKTAPDLHAFVSDFSIPSALANVPPLKSALKSKNRSQKQAIDQVAKTAVIVMTMHGADGPYKELKTK